MPASPPNEMVPLMPAACMLAIWLLMSETTSTYSFSRAIRSTWARKCVKTQATVTLAEALIAQTGSILVTAACGGRGASVIAPCHIVYATVAQLVPDLATALSRVSQER
ncbi:MAG: LUD domain-containing protein, partial [Mycobacterium sp.]